MFIVDVPWLRLGYDFSDEESKLCFFAPFFLFTSSWMELLYTLVTVIGGVKEEEEMG